MRALLICRRRPCSQLFVLAVNNATIAQGYQDLVRALATAGKPIVLLLIEGRPRVLNGTACCSLSAFLG